MPEQLTALIERVSFYNEETGFSVLRVRVEASRELATVVGNLPSVVPGEVIEAIGEWVVDRQHGRQFKASEVRTDVPRTRKGIEKYLASGAIRGIRGELARRIVAKFGTETLEVIEKSPRKLLKVAGIGEKRVRMIRDSWEEAKGNREVMLFLHSHGVGAARAGHVFRRYGPSTIALISENPYRLADDIRGFGFLTADRLAQSLGFDRASPFRIRSGVHHVLDEALSAGHCGLPREDLVEVAARLLEVDPALVETSIVAEVTARRVVEDSVADRKVIFPPRVWEAEKFIARDLTSLAQGRPPWPVIDPDRAIPWVEKRVGIELAPSQRSAVALALRSKVTVITGGPGVGKTTLVDAILRILSAKDIEISLCAPTGRAAKRLTESTGREAKTIHRLLEVDPVSGTFRRDEQNHIEADLLVVDEMSMVDVLLMDALVRALPPHAALLLVGDADQLPSVGPGQVLADIIASGVIPVVRLTEIFRQAAESMIIVNAHRIHQGQIPLASKKMDEGSGAPAGDFYFTRPPDAANAADRIVRIVAERIPERFGLDPLRDVQVLCPMYKGAAGVDALNIALKERLNPGRQESERLTKGQMTFATGDKVMQIVNNYEQDVFNGDIGIVSMVDPEDEILEVSFDGHMVPYTVDSLDQLRLAYATTIHKSQGSEYPAVVISMLTQHYVMLQRNLLYTAVTRGRRLVVLVGEDRAVEIAVRNDRVKRRCSKLREWLRTFATGGVASLGGGPADADLDDLAIVTEYDDLDG